MSICRLSILVFVLSAVSLSRGAGAQTDAPNVTATYGTDCNAVVLTWDAVSGPEFGFVFNYRVWRSETSEVPPQPLDAASSLPASTRSFTDLTAQPGVEYNYWVVAGSTINTEAIPAADPVQGLRADTPQVRTPSASSDDCTGITVTWEMVPGETYTLLRSSNPDGSGAVVISSDATSPFADVPQTGNTDPLRGPTYYYQVQSGNACGTSALSQVAAGSRPVSDTPTNLNATDGTGCDGVTVTWDQADNATRYRLWRTLTPTFDVSTAELLVITADAAQTSYTDKDVLPGTVYTYWIQSGDQCGFGLLASGETGFYTEAGPVTGLVAQSPGCSINLSWNAATNATSYDVLRGNQMNPDTAVVIANTASLSFVDTTAPTNIFQRYWIRPLVAGCPGDLSAMVSGIRSVVEAPSTPTNVDATDTLCDRIRVNWNVNGAAQFEVHRSTTPSSGSSVLLGTTNEASYTDFDVLVGQTYYYFIRAMNDCGMSGLSNSGVGRRGTPTSINSQPDGGGSLESGDTFSSSVSASGTGPFSYLWRRDGDPLFDDGRITGTNTATITISPVRLADAGTYTVDVFGSCGTVTSTPVMLTVTCDADVNNDGLLSVGDILDFLSAWSSTVPSADINGDGLYTVGDILDFLALWASGC